MIKKVLALVFLALGICSAQTAVFPNGVATTPQLMQAGNNLATKLTSPVTSSATAVFVQNTTGFAPNMLITFGDTSEIAVVCQVTSFVQLTIGYNGTCPSTTGRGFDGTTAAAHITGAQVFGYYTAWHHNVENKEITAIESAIPNTVSDIGSSSLAAACAAASGRTLNISKQWTGLATQTCGSPLAFVGGGSIQPASGQMVTITVQNAPLAQICDISLGGNCIITTPNNSLPIAWWGAQPGHNSAAALQAALNSTGGTQAATILIPNSGQLCYDIESPVVYTALSYSAVITFEGVNTSIGQNGGSCLLWTGAVGGTMITLNGGLNTTMKHLTINGNNTAAVALHIDSFANYTGTPAGPGCIPGGPAPGNCTYIGKSGDVYEDLSISQVTSKGIQVGHILNPNGTSCGAQSTRLDTLTFTNVNVAVHNPVIPGSIAFDWQCGGNTEEFVMNRSGFSLGDINVKILNAGSVLMLHPEFFNAGTADIEVSTAGLTIISPHSEQGAPGARFLIGDAGGTHQSVSVYNGVLAYTLPADDFGILNTGQLVLEGNVFINARTVDGSGNPTSVFKVATNCVSSIQGACARPTSIISRNNQYAAANLTTVPDIVFPTVLHWPNSPFWWGSAGAPNQDYYSIAQSNWGANRFTFTSENDSGGYATNIILPNYSPDTLMGPQAFALSGTNPCDPPMAPAFDLIGPGHIGFCTGHNQWNIIPFPSGPSGGPAWAPDATTHNLVTNTLTNGGAPNVCVGLTASGTCQHIFGVNSALGGTTFYVDGTTNITHMDEAAATVYSFNGAVAPGNILCITSDGHTIGTESTTAGPCI